MPTFLLLVLALLPTPVLAYIGPGAGISAIGTAVALISALFLLVAGFIWYPVKRLLRRRAKDHASGHDGHRS